MDYHFRNLVFESGGAKAIAYVGALEGLQDKGILKNIIRVGGFSLGCIQALLIAFNYSLPEMKKILSQNIIFSLKNIKDIIVHKTNDSNITFKQMYEQHKDQYWRQLFLVGINKSQTQAIIFSHEHTPSTKITDAVTFAMSIPPLFIMYKTPLQKVCKIERYVYDNPISMFDRKTYIHIPENSILTVYYNIYNRIAKQKKKEITPFIYNKETLGFRLSSNYGVYFNLDQSKKIGHKNEELPTEYPSVLESILRLLDSRHLHRMDWDRTIYIDSIGVGSLDYELNENQKKALIRSGSVAIGKYIEWFEHPDSWFIDQGKEPPKNRVPLRG